jgi:hypothetical protein
MITTYKLTEFEEDEFEDFLNKMYNGLEYYKKKNPDMMIKVIYDWDHKEITVKTFFRVGSSN